MPRIRTKDWSKFQHYKERAPSWIKLHKNLLDDYKFHRLQDASRALAPMIWLLASEKTDGVIDMPWDELAFRLHLSEEKLQQAAKPLFEAGFFILEQDASGALADCEPNTCLEESREQAQEEKILPDTSGPSKQSYSQLFEKFWAAYPTDKNMPKKKAFAVWQRLSPEKRDAAIAAIPGFQRYCDQNKSWYRTIYADRFLSQEKFEGYAAEKMPTAEEIAVAKDRADKLLRRGKYAEVYQ